MNGTIAVKPTSARWCFVPLAPKDSCAYVPNFVLHRIRWALCTATADTTIPKYRWQMCLITVQLLQWLFCTAFCRNICCLRQSVVLRAHLIRMVSSNVCIVLNVIFPNDRCNKNCISQHLMHHWSTTHVWSLLHYCHAPWWQVTVFLDFLKEYKPGAGGTSASWFAIGYVIFTVVINVSCPMDRTGVMHIVWFWHVCSRLWSWHP